MLFSSTTLASRASTVTTTPSAGISGSAVSVYSVIPSTTGAGSDANCGCSGSRGAVKAASASPPERSTSVNTSSPPTIRGPAGRDGAGSGTVAGASSVRGISRKGLSSGSSETGAATGAGRWIVTSAAPSAAEVRADASTGAGTGSGWDRSDSGLESGSGSASVFSSPDFERWSVTFTTDCLTRSTILPPLSTIALPAVLTVLMKLRLMNTPVRIQAPSNRMIFPSTPITLVSLRATSTPKAPPHPLPKTAHFSPKAKPNVREPRIRINKAPSTEWLKSSGRWRMIRTPTIVTIRGKMIPNRPNERPTRRSANQAPA